MSISVSLEVDFERMMPSAWHAFLKGKNCRLSVYSSTSDLINDQNGGLGIDFPAFIQSVLIILLLFLSYSRPCIGFNNLYSLQFEVDDMSELYSDVYKKENVII